MQRIALVLAVVSMAVFGCASRSVTTKVVDYYDLDIKLRGKKAFLGGYEPLGYAQPVEISAQRLANILGGIEVDIRKSESSPVRERRPALSAKMLLSVSKALPQAFAEASANQQIIVMALRKQMQKGVFNRKYLTSFTTYVKDDDLYVFFSRIEWPVDETTKTTRIPEPWPGEVVMPFETVETPTYTRVGTQGVRVRWRNSEFGPTVPSAPAAPSAATPDPEPADKGGHEAKGAAGAAAESSAAAESAAAGTTAESADTTPTTAPAKTESAAPAAGAIAPAAAAPAAPKAPPTDPLQGLTAQDLRDLASLEESYQAGRMDTEQYQRERARILARGR